MNNIKEIASRFGVEWKLLIAQIINFCIFSFSLYFFIIKKIMENTSKRQKLILESIDNANTIKKNLENINNEKNKILIEANKEAKNIIDIAQKEAFLYLDEQVKNAKIEYNNILLKAKKEIELEKKQIFFQNKKEIYNLVLDTSRTVLSKSLDSNMKYQFDKIASSSLYKIFKEKNNSNE